MKLTRSFIKLSVLSLALLLSDCSCRKDTTTIKRVLLEFPSSAQGFSRKINQDKFSSLVRSVIEGNEHFDFDAANDDGAVLQLTIMPQISGGRSKSVMLIGSLPGKKNGEPSLRAFADIQIKNGSAKSADIKEGVVNLFDNLHQMLSNRSADNQYYIDRIKDHLAGNQVSQGELLNAITALGESSGEEAIEPLTKLLGVTKDLGVGNAAMIALSQLSATTAVPAIIDFSERKPTIIRRQAIAAVKRIGSKEAAEWLYVMSRGHDDPLVRKEAQDAFFDVEERLSRTP